MQTLFFKGMMSFLSGKSDPYVKIYMNCENQDITPVINDNLNPKWNHSTIMRTYRDDVSVQFNVSKNGIVKCTVIFI